MVLRFAERRLVERHLDVGFDRARLAVHPAFFVKVFEDVLPIRESEREAARIGGEDALAKADALALAEGCGPSSCRGRTSTLAWCGWSGSSSTNEPGATTFSKNEA